jgi:putative tricarboxylic transport membrane protein
MGALHGMLYGFSVALTPMNLFYCFVGCLMGTLVGVLPGLGPGAAIALLIPVTFHVDPVGAVIMLAGIFYGAMYGGSTTSILVNIPGESASVITCLDGYQMARKGLAGPALGISAYGSFIASTFSVIGMMFFAPLLAEAALKFGPPEYFMLMVMSMTFVTYLSKGSMVKALMMVALGLILAIVGMDPVSSKLRFNYGILTLRDGLGLAPVVMGLFGISEVLSNVGVLMDRSILKGKIKNLLPTWEDCKVSFLPITRGSLLGFFMGVLPGIGPIIPTFISYSLEKKISKHPEKFGTGVIEGVAAPEACNNATSVANFIPMLSLGIPTNAIMGILLGAWMILGVQPGPLLIKEKPDLFWGLISSMYIGNGMLLILNLPLIPLWVQLLKIPYAYLSPMILLFCLIGVYSINNSLGDVLVMVIFGGVGLLMRYFNFEAAPLILAMVLGPMMEDSLRQSLIISKGSFFIFVSRPIAAVLLAAILSIFVASLFRLRPPKKLRVDEE